MNYIHLDPRELALQIVDIVALRPEIEICYIGISSKCFEVLENKRLTERHASHDTSTNAANAGPGGIDPDDPSDSDEDDDEEDVDDEDEDANEATTTTATAADAQETDSDASSEEDDSDNEEEENGAIGDKQRPRLKLREILFYDDKVSIFKARHGRL